MSNLRALFKFAIFCILGFFAIGKGQVYLLYGCATVGLYFIGLDILDIFIVRSIDKIILILTPLAKWLNQRVIQGILQPKINKTFDIIISSTIRMKNIVQDQITTVFRAILSYLWITLKFILLVLIMIPNTVFSWIWKSASYILHKINRMLVLTKNWTCTLMRNFKHTILEKGRVGKIFIPTMKLVTRFAEVNIWLLVKWLFPFAKRAVAVSCDNAVWLFRKYREAVKEKQETSMCEPQEPLRGGFIERERAEKQAQIERVKHDMGILRGIFFNKSDVPSPFIQSLPPLLPVDRTPCPRLYAFEVVKPFKYPPNGLGSIDHLRSRLESPNKDMGQGEIDDTKASSVENEISPMRSKRVYEMDIWDIELPQDYCTPMPESHKADFEGLNFSWASPPRSKRSCPDPEYCSESKWAKLYHEYDAWTTTCWHQSYKRKMKAEKDQRKWLRDLASMLKKQGTPGPNAYRKRGEIKKQHRTKRATCAQLRVRYVPVPEIDYEPDNSMDLSSIGDIWLG